MRSSPRFDTIAPTGLITFRKHTKINRACGILKCSKIAPAEKHMQRYDTTRNSSRKDQDCHANAGLSHRGPISSRKKKKIQDPLPASENRNHTDHTGGLTCKKIDISILGSRILVIDETSFRIFGRPACQRGWAYQMAKHVVIHCSTGCAIK